MSKKVEEKIEELFLHKEKIIDLEILENIIRKQKGFFSNSNKKIILEKINSEAIISSLQKLEPENVIGFDDSTTDERSRTLFNNSIREITKSGKTLEDKFALISNFIIEDKPTDKSISKILSKLTVIRILNSLIFDYQGATAGNLHEAFVAALTDSSIITRGKSDLADITAQGGISLKLISRPSDAKGSINNLFATLLKRPNGIQYYLGFKDTQKKQYTGKIFYFFLTINQANLHETTNIYEILNISNSSNLPIQKLKMAYEKYISGKKQDFETQFTLKQEYIFQQTPIMLDVSKESLTNCIERNSKLLAKDVESISINLNNLLSNISNFYFSKNKKSASYALEGATNAENLKNTLYNVGNK